jgi:hypothetical protein
MRPGNAIAANAMPILAHGPAQECLATDPKTQSPVPSPPFLPPTMRRPATPQTRGPAPRMMRVRFGDIQAWKHPPLQSGPRLSSPQEQERRKAQENPGPAARRTRQDSNLQPSDP